MLVFQGADGIGDETPPGKLVTIKEGEIMFDEPWVTNPDSELPINDLGGSDEPIDPKPF